MAQTITLSYNEHKSGIVIAFEDGGATALKRILNLLRPEKRHFKTEAQAAAHREALTGTGAEDLLGITTAELNAMPKKELVEKLNAPFHGMITDITVYQDIRDLMSMKPGTLIKPEALPLPPPPPAAERRLNPPPKPAHAMKAAPQAKAKDPAVIVPSEDSEEGFVKEALSIFRNFATPMKAPRVRAQIAREINSVTDDEFDGIWNDVVEQDPATDFATPERSGTHSVVPAAAIASSK